MVINLTDEFSDQAKEKADENGIILINGLTFASLLVRYILNPEKNTFDVDEETAPVVVRIFEQ